MCFYAAPACFEWNASVRLGVVVACFEKLGVVVVVYWGIGVCIGCVIVGGVVADESEIVFLSSTDRSRSLFHAFARS